MKISMKHLKIQTIWKKRTSNKGGFTLLETLIYLSMLVVLLSAIVQAVLLLSTHYRAVRNTRDIEDSGIIALDRLVRTARNADSISAASSTFGVHPGVVTFVSNDLSSGQSTTTQFSINSGGRLVLYENGVYMGPLTKESVTVVGFIAHLITTSHSTAVRLEISLQSDQATPAVISKNFYDTVVLRGSYQ